MSMSDNRERRRRLVHLLIGINGAGFVLCGTAMGGLVKTETIPWFGLAGCVVMFVGVVMPFYREFLAIRAGFSEVERETMSGIRRRRGDTDYQEVLPAGPARSPFERVRAQPLYAIFITILGWGLVAVEAVRWLMAEA